MKFKIERTSMYSDERPCEEAKLSIYTMVDKRTFKSFDEYEERLRHKFTSMGENHRVVPGGIARDFPGRECWGIELNSLEDLIVLAKKYGEIIITGCDDVGYDADIEIYDTYRE